MGHERSVIGRWPRQPHWWSRLIIAATRSAQRGEHRRRREWTAAIGSDAAIRGDGCNSADTVWARHERADERLGGLGASSRRETPIKPLGDVACPHPSALQAEQGLLGCDAVVQKAGGRLATWRGAWPTRGAFASVESRATRHEESRSGTRGERASRGPFGTSLSTCWAGRRRTGTTRRLRRARAAVQSTPVRSTCLDYEARAGRCDRGSGSGWQPTAPPACRQRSSSSTSARARVRKASRAGSHKR